MDNDKIDLYETDERGYRGLTEAGADEAERRGLDVDVDAIGHAFACHPHTREVVDMDEPEPEDAGEYVVLTDEESWGCDTLTEDDHDAACARAEAWLDEHEGPHYSISVRRARHGEVAGTYYVKPGGDLQILGYSLGVPEAVEDLIRRAWEHACDTWPSDEPAEADERPNDVIRIEVCEDQNVGGLFLRAHQRDGQERDIPLDEQAVVDCDGDPEAVADEIRSQVRQDALTGTVADDCEIVGTDLLPCCAACTETGRPLGVTHHGERMCSRCMREIVGDDADWRDEPSDW